MNWTHAENSKTFRSCNLRKTFCAAANDEEVHNDDTISNEPHHEKTCLRGL